MEEIINKLRKIKLQKHVVLTVLAVVVFIVLLLSEFIKTEEKESADVYNTSLCGAQYVKDIEKELESILSKINGAGDVQAMVTLESCYENVYAKGYKTKNEHNENKDSTETSEEYIIVKNGSNNEECLVVKVYEPTVKGVAIVAEGADNVNVKKAITETVCALFGISSAKVSVEKMENK